MAFEHNQAYATPAVLLPHKPDLLLVTSIQEMHRDELGKTQRVEAAFTPGEEHFWGRKTLRWMKVLESLAQASALGIYQDNMDAGIEGDQQPSPLFKFIEEAKFEHVGKSVVPGDTMALDVLLAGSKGSKFNGNATARVGDDVVCTATFGGRLNSPRLTDAFYDALWPTVITVDDGNRDVSQNVLDLGDDQREIWIDSAEAVRGTGGHGEWYPTRYQYKGHEFGEKKAGEQILRPATPILPGIKHVGFAEDLTRVAYLDERIRLIGVRAVDFSGPIVEGQRVIADAVFHETGKGLISEARIRLLDEEMSSHRTQATLIFKRQAA